MRQYLNLLQKVLDEGVLCHNRTGIDTLRIVGDKLEFDLKDGFPAVTTKRLAWKAVVGELLAFLDGADNASYFRAYGCKIWDQNANENKTWLENRYRRGQDDLGRIYGVQWRRWKGDRRQIDQIQEALDKVLNDPWNRRIIVNAWNPDDLDKMALPPCHILFQLHCNPNTREMSMTMYQRSCDMFLGVPFNIASYALLLSMFAWVSGYTPRKLVMFLADVHIYTNHIDQVKEQLTREPKPLPQLKILRDLHTHISGGTPTDDAVFNISICHPEDFLLANYSCWPAIKGEMAV